MKKYLNLLMLISLIITYSCSEDILKNDGSDGSNPTQFFTNAQLAEGTNTNPEIPAAFVNGIYAQMVQVGTGGSTSQEDFGQKGFDIYSDMLSGDMALSQSSFGWYRAAVTEFQAPLDFTLGTNRIPWRYYYRIIRSCNTVIQSLGGNDFTPELAENKFAMGQAKAMRAHSYFYLTQFFQKEYVASEMILPIYTEAISTNLAKSSAEDVYALMEKDLTEAISLLNGFNRGAKNEVNVDVAKMIFAYVLGAKGGRDAQVASLTNDVINAGNYTMLSQTQLVASASGVNGFNNLNSPSWMWGFDITPTNGLGLISWWGQVDAWSFSYAWAGDYKTIDNSLYSKIAANDGRRGQFFNNPTNARNLQPLFKFRAPSAGFGGAPRPITSDYVYMRIEEAYLLNAEANANAGSVGLARTSLKALLSRRLPDASYVDGLSGQALKNEIYLQTRIELWGEGKSYLAMKRNKATTVRGTNHLSFVGVPIPYNDERMQFEIPLDEIQNNPFLSEQNQ